MLSNLILKEILLKFLDLMHRIGLTIKNVVLLKKFFNHVIPF